VEDADAIAALVEEGFEGYRSFLGPEWPLPRLGAEELRPVLARPSTWSIVAEEDGALCGTITLVPGEESRTPEPGIAHVSELFVRPAHQGTGLATDLLARAVRAAAPRPMRLFTPAGHARARRFYEREGWRRTSEPFASEGLGMDLVEYRRETA
jgi:GNAT superfamily N-acetyltransferase